MATLLSGGQAVKENRRRRRRSAVVLLLAAMWVLPPLSSAQGEGEEQKFRQTGSMREWVYKDLGKAQEKTEAAEFDEALRLLDSLTRKDINSYERSQCWNLYAFIHYSQERYPQAIEAYKKLLGEEAVLQPVKTSTIYSLSLVYFATEQWPEAIERMVEWFALTPDPKPQHYELLAQAHHQLQQYREALVPLKKAMTLRREAGEPATERNYLLLRVFYFELGELEEVATVLEQLIRLFPNKTYWSQLSGIYSQLGHEEKWLNSLELAYLQGFLETENEVMALVGLMINSDLPYRAAKVLEKGLADGTIESSLDRWRLLSQCWLLSREDRKAVPTLIRASDLSETGELDIILAQSYMNLEDWRGAADSARKAIDKGGLTREDQAYVMLGQVLFYMDAFTESSEAFAQASRDDRSRKLASQWQKYVESEMKAQAQIKAALEDFGTPQE